MPILKDGKEKGELRFDVSYFPVLQPTTNEAAKKNRPIPVRHYQYTFFRSLSEVFLQELVIARLGYPPGKGPGHNQGATVTK